MVDPDLAIAYRNGKRDDKDDLRALLKSDHIYFDAFKGTQAPENELKAIFGTDDTLVIAQKIMAEGEIQLTHEYRENLRVQKIAKILAIIHRNAVDPKTNAPHPLARLENALKEVHIRIDDIQSAEDQVQDVVKALQPIIPMKFAVAELQVHVPAAMAPKMFGTIKSLSKIIKEEWLGDGSWSGIVEVPAGVRLEFIDALESKTHGSVTVKLLREH